MHARWTATCQARLVFVWSLQVHVRSLIIDCDFVTVCRARRNVVTKVDANHWFYMFVILCTS